MKLIKLIMGNRIKRLINLNTYYLKESMKVHQGMPAADSYWVGSNSYFKNEFMIKYIELKIRFYNKLITYIYT